VPSRAETMARQRKRIARNQRALAPLIARWLRKVAKAELEEAIRGIKTGKLKLRKASLSASDKELLDLLVKFGLRQIDAAGNDLAIGYGGEWEISPKLVEEIIRQKKIHITKLSRTIKQEVLAEIRRIVAKANRQDPRPSVGQLARTLRERFDEAKDPPWAISSRRAALIARTESQQNESTGSFAGMDALDVEAKEWLASGNVHRGERRHDLMDGMQVLLHEPFVNPTTFEELMHPGDPNADISETANCGCGFRAIRIKDMKPKWRPKK
jgi:hypothetical protein